MRIHENGITPEIKTVSDTVELLEFTYPQGIKAVDGLSVKQTNNFSHPRTMDTCRERHRDPQICSRIPMSRSTKLSFS